MEERKDGIIVDPKSWKIPNITISTTVEPELYRLAKENNLSWKDCLEFGIKFVLAEQYIVDYPQNELLNKIETLTKMIQDLNLKLEEKNAEKL